MIQGARGRGAHLAAVVYLHDLPRREVREPKAHAVCVAARSLEEVFICGARVLANWKVVWGCWVDVVVVVVGGGGSVPRGSLT